MLRSLKLCQTASYGPTPVDITDLRAVNFFFGCNAAGKSTIGRVLAEPEAYPRCNPVWESSPLEVLLYNKDFADRLIGDAAGMPGVFTLGEDNNELLKQIATAEADLEKHTQTRDALRRNLDGDESSGDPGRRKQRELDRVSFDEKCWPTRKAFDGPLQEALKGSCGSMKAFADEVLRRAAVAEPTELDGPLPERHDLLRDAETLYGEPPEREQPISAIAFGSVAAPLQAEVLKRVIAGAADTGLSVLIAELESGDWVQRGRPFLSDAEGTCPFCQQPAPTDLEDQLSALFDGAYKRDVAKVETAEQRHSAAVDATVEALRGLRSHPRIPEGFAEALAEFELLCGQNHKLFTDKIREPSRVIEPVAIDAAAEKLTGLLAEVNGAIEEHNRLVDGFRSERSRLGRQIWRLIGEELRDVTTRFHAEDDKAQKTIKGMEGRLDGLEQRIREEGEKIKALQEHQTSVQPTVNRINDRLKAFGYRGFTLKAAEDTDGVKSRYRLARPGGESASDTLSEGERTLIAVLYFMARVEGHATATGSPRKRLVVLDDPISSLDADALFIVSTLVKELLGNVTREDGSTKQVFLLTHNLYFFKEVSDRYDGHEKTSKRAFWLVRRPMNESCVERFDENPVKSAYELIWRELRTEASPVTAQNAMRRILEHHMRYRQKKIDAVIGLFEEEEKLAAATLLSWVNDGSHSIHDDLSASLTEVELTRMREIFRRIFEHLDLLEHHDEMLNLVDPATPRAEDG